MRKSLSLLVSLLVFCSGSPARADSPLTSADFHLQYQHPMVKTARKGTLTPALTSWLLRPGKTPLKAAVINALGWRRRQNASIFLTALAAKYKTTPGNMRMATPTAEELFVLGYLAAMGDYQRLGPMVKKAPGIQGKSALDLLKEAVKRDPTDFTIALINALVTAQSQMKASFCKVYETVNTVLVAFPSAKKNLKEDAVIAIVAYTRHYKKYCPKFKKRPNRYKDFNSANQLFAWKQFMVVVSYKGIVLWDRKTLKASRLFAKKYLRSAAGDATSLWALSTKNVERFDGKKWKTLGVNNRPRTISVRCGHRKRKWCKVKEKLTKLPFHYSMGFIRESSSTPPLIHVNGRLWRYQPVLKRFIEEASNPFTNASHFYLLGDEMWGYDYYRGITRFVRWSTPVVFPLRSTSFRGKALRTLAIDGSKNIWAVAYKGDLYRLTPGASVFQRFGGPKKIIGVAFDGARDRMWMLHRDMGVYLYKKGRRARHFFLEDLEYARDILRDAEGRVWVSGGNGLAVIDDTTGKWRTRYAVLTKRP
ncbi:hypothetical protein KKF84_17765 [Myxococcota bacterium]|nr:hypothetical protein [Myxococcota bacterium]MBU1537168.1 hypothetical protein [Myxococcota bacterium]